LREAEPRSHRGDERFDGQRGAHGLAAPGAAEPAERYPRPPPGAEHGTRRAADGELVLVSGHHQRR